MDLELDINVYSPSDDTILLLEYFIQFINKDFIDGKKLSEISYILDMGTGTGIIALFLAKYFKSNQYSNIKIYASDIILDAIKLAKKNAQKNGLEKKIHFIQSNLFDNFPYSLKNKFNIIFFNPPYLPSEPSLNEYNQKKIDYSWKGGEHGLEVFEKFLVQSSEYLSPIGKNNIYFVFSSNSSLEVLYKKIKELGYKLKILNKKHIFFEDLILYRITRI